MTVRNFCNQVYGVGKVSTFETTSDGEYNDEGGTNYSVYSIRAFDADGEDVLFDLTLPFWMHVLKDISSYRDDTQDAALDALKDYYASYGEEKEQKEQQGWIGWYELPCDVHNGGDETYNLTEEPAVSTFIA